MAFSLHDSKRSPCRLEEKNSLAYPVPARSLFLLRSRMQTYVSLQGKNARTEAWQECCARDITRKVKRMLLLLLLDVSFDILTHAQAVSSTTPPSPVPYFPAGHGEHSRDPAVAK